MEETYKSKPKSRFLSTFEYYELIQVEYLTTILRARIYTKPKDKEYWNKVAAGKKKTIEEISERNRLPSIFNDSDLLEAMNKRIYRDSTYPIFTYKDEKHREQQEYLDLFYYYYPNAPVRFDSDQEVKIGVVKEYKHFATTILITCDGEDVKIPVSKVTRIL